MEKRVFSLHSPYIDYASLVYAAILVPLWGYTLWHFWGDVGKRVTMLICVVCMVWVFVRDCLWNRNHKLEISDDGLVETAWLKSKFCLSLDAIRRVEIRKRPWYLGGSESVAVIGHGFRVLRLPRRCPNSGSIVDTLRQRLPESVFEAG